MALRLFYNTNGLAHHRLGDAIDLVADLGYDGISITPDVPHLDPRTATPHDIDAAAAHIRRRGLDVSVQTGARFVLDPRRKHRPNLLERDPAERAIRTASLVRSLDIARDLGARVLSFWSGTPPEGDAIDVLVDRLVAGCDEVAAAAAVRGLRAALEPEPGMLVGTVAQFAGVRSRVDSAAFGLAFDVGHAHCTGEGDPAAIIRTHRHELLDVQIEDMRRGEHVHLAFGEGTLDCAPVIAALVETQYAGPVVVELSRDSYRAPDVAAAAIRHLRALGA